MEADSEGPAFISHAAFDAIRQFITANLLLACACGALSTAQWPRMARAKISAGNMTEDAKNAISSRRFQSPVAAERINVARVTHMIAAISDPHSPSLRATPGA